jgi:hypothetical protein
MVSSPVTGSYAWTISDKLISSHNAYIMIKARNPPSMVYATDINDAPFTIWNSTYGEPPPTPRITLITPNGGETLRNSTYFIINWNATDDNPLPANPISILYSSDNSASWSVINASYPNTGTYIWNVPDDVNSTKCLVKVECTNSASHTANDTSNATFTITNWTAPSMPDLPPKISLFSPTSGDVLYCGRKEKISWYAIDDGPLSAKCINITYSHDGGLHWQFIVANTSNTATYDWIIPNVTTYTAVIKVSVTDCRHHIGSNKSGNFTIIPAIPSLDHITIIPYDIHMDENHSQRFYAMGHDFRNNTVNVPAFMWTADDSIGTIDQTGYFTATHVGTGYVTVSYGRIEAYAMISVEVLPVKLSEIKIEPVYILCHPGDKVNITVCGYDLFDHMLGGFDYSLKLTGNIGYLSPAITVFHSVFTATKCGNVYLTGL